MNAYESRQLDRKERLERLAAKCEAAANAAHSRARQMASVIPLGQPILIGHHSEKRDRNYRGRFQRLYERSFELTEKAKRLRERAAGVGSGGISSDDPDAPSKIAERVAELEALQERMKKANFVVRAFFKAGLRHDSPDSEAPVFARYFEKMGEIGIRPGAAKRLLEPDFCGRRGFADFELTNNGANIRRLKARLGELAKEAKRVRTEHVIKGVRVIEEVDINRLLLYFPGKPAEEVRSRLKSGGFRWAPTMGAWSRQLNNGAVASAQYILSNIPEQGKEAA